MARFGATGRASKARMPEMNALWLCTDAKSTKRSQIGKDALSVGAQSFARMRNHTNAHRTSPYEKREMLAFFR